MSSATAESLERGEALAVVRGEGAACRIIQGHVIDALRSLEAGSVHAVVTSPPYWSLRKYAGAEAQVWGGAAAGCEHDWATGLSRQVGRNDHGTGCATSRLGPERDGLPGGSPVPNPVITLGDTCRLCQAYRGDLGLESTWRQYVANIVAVFREVKRVLRDDGTVALNLGDCHSTKPAGNLGPINDTDGAYARRSARQSAATGEDPQRITAGGYGIPEKCKLLLPHRVAIALIDDGWIVRQDCVQSKRNPLPESVRDRPTTSHEFVFLLVKQPRYYWDQEAVRETGAQPDRVRNDRFGGANGHLVRHGVGAISNGHSDRNMRSVIETVSAPFSAKALGIADVDHFAAMSPALVRPFILAGCPERCCPHCGAGWLREVERTAMEVRPSPSRAARQEQAEGRVACNGTMTKAPTSKTLGFRPGCTCPHTRDETRPGVCLDPFLGSGTTAEVALEHFRHAIGCELSADYVRIAQARIGRAVGLFTHGGVTVEIAAQGGG